MDDSLRSQLDEDMARLADGDRAVFSRVFRAVWPVIHGYCSRGLSATDADDAAQLVMEKVFSQASRYDASRPALPWLLAISAWECRTLRKRRERRREEALDLAHDAVSDDSPEATVMLRELHDAACVVLGQLSHADQQALASAYSDEVAFRSEVSGATLRKRRERALVRLREAWRKLYGR